MVPTLEDIRRIVDQHKKFLITTHVNPDGDGIGSELALAHFLRKLGKSVSVVNHSKTPDHYQFLDPNREIIQFKPEQDRDRVLEAEVIFILDTNQPDRLRSMEPFITQSKAVKIVIDHHLDAHGFADQYLIDEDATSTGEIVYRLLVSIDAHRLDKKIAETLYAAIMTDTGSFRYPRTDPEVHSIAAHLLQLGADPTQIYASIHESWSFGRMRLLGEALASMKLAYDGKLAYVVCTQQMFKDTGTTEVETDDFTTYPMSVKGVVVGILFNELARGTKISLRSKGDIPINELAKEFGGGGHKNAAGARLFEGTLEETVKAVIEKAGKYVSTKLKPQ